MADNLYRLVGLLVNICPEPLRKLFLTEANADTSTNFTTLNSYLVSKRSQIGKLYPDQKDLLFPASGHVDENEWDITLLSSLINKLFNRSLSSQVKTSVDKIKEVRNILQHLPNDSSVDDTQFENMWSCLETETLNLANLQGPIYGKIIKDKIDKARGENIPDQVNRVHKWYQKRFNELQKGFKEILDNAKKTTDILDSTTLTTVGPDGKSVKRVKIFREEIKRMHENFERTNNTEIPVDFVAPPEVDKIISKLRDNRLIVVSGHNRTLYLATALSAIKGMGYNEKRCVEIKSFSDWTHIDPEYVDFALCCDPFGKGTYDRDRAKGMAGIFDSIRATVNEERDGKKISVLIVSDINTLKECKEKYFHEILEEVVTVYDATSESRPTDLTVSECRTDTCSLNTTVIQNLSELTNLYLLQNQRQVNPKMLKAAKAIIKKHKSVLLSGRPRIGKTSLAIALAASYKPSQVLLLAFPEQIEHVNHHRTHLVIIEDLAGKYGFDRVKICNWYRTLDLLTLMKTAGKLNLIVTCDKGKLKKCFDEIAVHPLLEHKLKLNEQCVELKGENSSLIDNEAPSTKKELKLKIVAESEQYLSYTSSKGPNRRKSSSAFNKKECLCIKSCLGKDAGQNISVKSMCLNNDQSLYVVVETNSGYFLIFLEINSGQSVKYSLKHETEKICCIDNDEMVAATKHCNDNNLLTVIRVILITDGSVVYTDKESKEEFRTCSSMSYGNDENIYTLWDNSSIKIYNSTMDVIKQYTLSQGFTFHSNTNTIVHKEGHVYINNGCSLFYLNFVSGSSEKCFVNKSMGCSICVANDDPFTVFVANSHANTISKYKMGCEKVSNIAVDIDIVYGFQMVFDKENKRFVFHEQLSHKIFEAYVQ